ncbi:hypothetical protein KKI24_02535 [bacterium]|nr:hypothetical protein [bacterium]
MGERTFTDNELNEMGKLTLDLIHEAIDSNEPEKAKGLCKRMHLEFQFMHDLYRDWVTALMTHIYENHGEEDLYQGMRKAVGTYLKSSVALHQKSSFRERVKLMIAGARGHCQPIEVAEDDEKVILKLKCCAGVSLLKDGFYGPPHDFTMITKPHLMTFNMTDFPVYCCHAPIQEELAIEWIGEPVYVSMPAEKMALEGCRCLIYKDPQSIPEAIYERVNKKKAGS